MTRYSTLDNPIIVPVQRFAYELACKVAIVPDDFILDVGFGLGYGLNIMRRLARRIIGVEIDERAIALAYQQDSVSDSLYLLYDGLHLPFADSAFDVVTCIDVLEHVADYDSLLSEMYRVSRRCVFISSPNQRSENTNPDGKPSNYWHLREWSYADLRSVLRGYETDWHFINRSPSDLYYEGDYGADTQALVPVIRRAS